tara:strand:- start:131799 stop:131900 length:102 start_codon:yes stop_codon:yes gene_type:complete
MLSPPEKSTEIEMRRLKGMRKEVMRNKLKEKVL